MEKEFSINKLENIDLLSINDLGIIDSEISFYVADYQRGYRWESEQVKQLLKDIHQNPKGKTYCLQPVMLTKKEDANHSFEVIDGQQRLTTLFIILKVLNKRGNKFQLPFTIDYATRKSCIGFLKDIEAHPFVTQKDDIEVSWDAVPDQDKNVDNYHLFSSYHTIFQWLEQAEINESEFLEKVVKDVKLIWHPVTVTESSNAKKLFRNINSGKIRLTSSDLIKALFVLLYQNLNLPLAKRNQLKTEFANQWNEIEKQLNQDSFWFFINNGENENFATRIALLFDIVTKNTATANKYASYLKYAEGLEPLDWKKIVDVFRKIHEWYTDEKYYHRIGFLVNSKKMSFSDIVNLYDTHKTKPKSVFYNELEKTIENFKKSFDLSSINYKDQRFTCKNVLLLYNILIFEKDFPKQKFPFDMYVNEEWSLEHIHPQNPQDFTNIDDVLFWLEDTKNTLHQKNKLQDENLPVMEKIDAFIIEAKSVNTIYNKEKKDKIREIKDLLEMEVATHKINNLALLDKTTNSKLGNGLFKNKREIILKIDGEDEGNYVPYATVNCFLKRYTSKNNLQNEFWSETDAESYLENIKTVMYGK